MSEVYGKKIVFTAVGTYMKVDDEELDDEKEILHRLSAFEASKMHASSQSIQTVLVTTMGLARGVHAGVMHRVVSHRLLFFVGMFFD